MMTGFFILSGFVLFYSSNRKKLSDWIQIKRFYQKRASEILPAYYVTAIIYIVFLGKESIEENFLLMPVEVLGIQSFFHTLFPITHNSGTWFISCILFCYLLFPFILEVVKQMKQKEKLFILFISIFVLLYSPFVIIRFGLSNIYSTPFFRILEFLIGILLASMMEVFEKSALCKKYLFTVPAVVFEVLLMITSVTYASKHQMYISDYMMYSWLCLPVFILMIPGLAGIQFKENKVIIYFSVISYPFFLVQFFLWPIMRKIMEFTGSNSNTFKVLMTFVLCTILVIGFYQGIEKPIKKTLHGPSI